MGCVGSDTKKDTKGKVQGTVNATNTSRVGGNPQTNSIHLNKNNPSGIYQSGNNISGLNPVSGASGNYSPTPVTPPYQSPVRPPSSVQPQPNILDSHVASNVNTLNNRASEEITYGKNEMRDSYNSINNRISENANKVFESKPYESGTGLGLGLSGKLNNEVVPPASALMNSLDQSRGNEVLNNISNNMFIPTAVPYPQKPNFDWVKDIDEEHFHSKFEIVTIPNIDLKIS